MDSKLRMRLNLFAFILLCCSYFASGSRFPPGFFWGSSTAAYQVEGAWSDDGRGPSIWDEFSHEGGKVANNETGDIAADHYHRFREDVDLIRKLGTRHYRFSVSWSRVIPTGIRSDGVNEIGIQWYENLVDLLLENGITPHICLYHWDLPLKLQEMIGGWMNPKIVDHYLDYAELIFSRLGSKVKHWYTFNEPLTFVLQGFGTCIHAPGTCSKLGNGDSIKDPYIVAHHVLLAHARTSDLFRQKFLMKTPDSSVSIIVNSDFFYPMHEDDPSHQRASERAMIFNCAWFTDPLILGQYPEEMLSAAGSNMTRFTDEESELLKKSIFGPNGPVLALNHYTSNFVRPMTEEDRVQLVWPNGIELHADVYVSKFNGSRLIGPRAESSWLMIVPKGIRSLLNWVDHRYNEGTKEKLAFMITENGVDCLDEAFYNFQDDVLEDICRVNYLEKYIENVALAIEEDNVDVRGYFVWSLLDNFEWADGYSKKFGIVNIDYADGQLKRIPKKSFYWFQNFIKQSQNFSPDSDHIIELHW